MDEREFEYLKDYIESAPVKRERRPVGRPLGCKDKKKRKSKLPPMPRKYDMFRDETE